MGEDEPADVNGEDGEDAFFEDAPPGRWLAITGPLTPTRAAVLSVALEKAGIAVVFIRPEEHDVFPTDFGAHRPQHQQLAVLEDQVERARAVMARADEAFALNTISTAQPPVVGPRATAPVGSLFPGSSVPRERIEERAFEAQRVRRYTKGLLVFVLGLAWTLVVIPRARNDTALAVVGVLALCGGLLMIYSALSLRRKDEEEEPGG